VDPPERVELLIDRPDESKAVDENLALPEAIKPDPNSAGSASDPTGAPLPDDAAALSSGDGLPPSSPRWVLSDGPRSASRAMAEQTAEFLLANEPVPELLSPAQLLAPPPTFDSPKTSTHATSPQIEFPRAAEPEPPRVLELEAAANLLELGDDISVAKIAAHLASLAGLQGCLLCVRHEHGIAGRWPDEFDDSALRKVYPALATVVDDRAERLGLGAMQHLTFFAESGCVTIFSKGAAHLAVFHRPRMFMPGVREQLSAMVAALAEA
jgi:hypothetical protein